MEIINGRYRIIEEIERDVIGIFYRCYDTIEERNVMMRIFHSDILKEANTTSLFNNISQMSSFYHPNISRIYNFALLNGIDYKNTGIGNFYYTFEDFETENRVDYKVLSREEIITVIKEILKVLKFLNFKGISYKYLNFSNLFIHRIDGKINVKLKNLIFMNYITDVYYNSILVNAFTAPEVVWENINIPQSDVYSFGLVLYYLYYGCDYNEKPFKSIEIEYGKNDLTDLILEMTKSNPEKRIASITKVADALSELLEFEQDKSDVKYYFNLGNKIKMIGRDALLKDAISKIHDYLTGISNVNAAFISGGSGLGKTRLASEINMYLGILGINRYFYKGEETRKKGIFLSLLDEIIAQKEIPFYLVKRYGYELVHLSQEAGKKYGMSDYKFRKKPVNPATDRNTVDIVSGFFAEYSMHSPSVLIVDTNEEISSFDLVVFNNILNRISESKIYIVLVCDDELKNRSYIKKWIKDGTVRRYGLSGLTEVQNTEFSVNLLGVQTIDDLSASGIYEITGGIPGNIIKLYDEMYKEKIITIDEDMKWNFSKLPHYIRSVTKESRYSSIDGKRIYKKEEDISRLKSRLGHREFINTLLKIGEAEMEEKRYKEAVEVYESAKSEILPYEDSDIGPGIKCKYTRALVMAECDRDIVKEIDEILAEARQNASVKIELEALLIKIMFYEKKNLLSENIDECNYALDRAVEFDEYYYIFEFQYFIAKIEVDAGNIEKAAKLLESTIDEYGNFAKKTSIADALVLNATLNFKIDYSSKKSFDRLNRGIEIIEESCDTGKLLKTKMILAEALVLNDMYKEAVRVLTSVHEILSESKTIMLETDTTTLLCRCYIKLNEYDKAHSVIKKIEIRIEEYEQKPEFNFKYCLACIDYYCNILNFDKAEFFLIEVKNNLKTLTDSERFEVDVIQFLIDFRRDNRLMNNKPVDFDLLNRLCTKVVLPYEAKILRNVLMHIAYCLISFKNYIDLQGIIDIDEKLSKIFDSRFLKTKSLIARGILEEDRIGAYNRILLLQKKSISYEDFWVAHKILAEEYMEKDRIYLAINSALTSFYSIKKLSQMINGSLRDKYILFDKSKLDIKRILARFAMRYSTGDGSLSVHNRYFFSSTYEEYFDVEEIFSALSDTKFIQNIYSRFKIGDGVVLTNCEDMMALLRGDGVQNIKAALSYCVQKMVGDRAFLFVSDEKFKISESISTDPNVSTSSISTFLSGIEKDREYYLVNAVNGNYGEMMIKENSKSFLIYPLRKKIMKSDFNDHIGLSRMQNSLIAQNTLFGYVAVETCMIYNNFTDEAVKALRSAMNFIRIIAENYYTKRFTQTDPKTGLYNRTFLMDEVSMNMLTSNQKKENFSIALFDLNVDTNNYREQQFKNDEEIISRATSRIKSMISRKTVFGRLNYNEFMIIIPGHTAGQSVKMLSIIAESVKKDISLKYGLDMNFSFGISEFPVHSNVKKDLIEKVEKSLYHAKGNRGSDIKFVIWDKDVEELPVMLDSTIDLATGDMSTDCRLIRSYEEISKIFRNSITNDVKISKIVDIIMNLTDANMCDIYEPLPMGGVIRTFHSKSKSRDDVATDEFDFNIDMTLVEKAMYSEKFKSFARWSGPGDMILSEEVPTWNSYIMTPLINSGISKGVLVLSTTFFAKEFDSYDMSLISTLSGILASLIE